MWFKWKELLSCPSSIYHLDPLERKKEEQKKTVFLFDPDEIQQKTGFFSSLFSISRVQDDRDRSIVDKTNFHQGTKPAILDSILTIILPHKLDEIFIVYVCLIRWHRLVKIGSISFQNRIKCELTHKKKFKVFVNNAPVPTSSFVILKDSQSKNFSGTLCIRSLLFDLLKRSRRGREVHDRWSSRLRH